TQKTEPDGTVVHYEYEANSNPRVGPGDWDGRLTRCYFDDDLENPTTPVHREITRSGNTITYPGGDSYTWEYDSGGEHVTGITRNATGQAVHWSYDLLHNLTAEWTDQESQASPLLNLAYQYRGASGQQSTC